MQSVTVADHADKKEATGSQQERAFVFCLTTSKLSSCWLADALPAMTDPMPVPSAGDAPMLDTQAARIPAAHGQTPELPVADEDAPHAVSGESAGILDMVPAKDPAATKDTDAARSPPTPRVILSGPLEQLRSNMTLAPFTINFSAQKQPSDMQVCCCCSVIVRHACCMPGRNLAATLPAR